MKKKTIAAAVALAGFAFSPLVSAVPAAPSPGSLKVQKALADHDYRGASIALNALITERLPSSDRGGPDPVLDRLFGEIAAAQGAAGPVAAILERLVASEKTRPNSRDRLLLATAREAKGQFELAASDYVTVAGDAAAAKSDRFASAVGAARLALMSNPRAALSTLDALPVPPEAAQRWEVDLLRARAAALLGDSEASETAIERAWTEAVDAGAEQGAVSRVAQDRAMSAGRKGDRRRMTALLAADRLNRTPNNVDALIGNAPLCGENGIGPEDTVVIEMLRQAPPDRPRVSLVWASRSGIAGTFLGAVTQSPGLQVFDGQAADVALRCRVSPSTNFGVLGTFDDLFLAWSTGRGAYPLLQLDPNEDPGALAGLLADRERRYGPNSVMLLPVLLRVRSATVATSGGRQDALARAAALARRVTDIAQGAGGPADLVLLSKILATGFDVAAQTKTAAAAQAEFQTLLTQAGNNPQVSLDVLYALVNGVATAPQFSSDFKAAHLTAALAILKARAGSNDRRAIALALRLIALKNAQGDAAAVKTIAREFGLAPDLCALFDPSVRFVSSNIVPDDYPTDLVQTLMQGRDAVEFDLTATGAAVQPRLLVADPPYAFDAITLEKSATIRYDPAKVNGSPVACRGAVQTVRWQLPY